MAKIFIICPVRNADSVVQEEIADYVSRLEQEGHQVHWPKRDTDQSDDHGIFICEENCDAVIDAGEIHIWWDPDSSGSKFDFGMLFALLRLGFTKKVVLINKVDYTGGRSFENVLCALARGYPLIREDLEETTI